MTEFKKGIIEDVMIRDLVRHCDERGWLTEIYRKDEVEAHNLPVMTYLSLTRPGIARGPHEHLEQTDLFAFPGPSVFRIFLWDNRIKSHSYLFRMEIELGENRPAFLVVPPGIVHGYKNIGDRDGLVINLPNRLYRGEGKQGDVDEVRHENDANSSFLIG
jgi:dTDP-4-dehydrorhamnose 3,5-epimerase